MVQMPSKIHVNITKMDFRVAQHDYPTITHLFRLPFFFHIPHSDVMLNQYEHGGARTHIKPCSGLPTSSWADSMMSLLLFVGPSGVPSADESTLTEHWPLSFRK